MTTNTPPPVGSTMKWGHLRAEVVDSSPEYLVLRGTGWLRALEYNDGEWRDHDGDAWRIEKPKPPTLSGGTVLTSDSYFDQTVVAAAPGLALVLDEHGTRRGMAWIDDGWRFTSAGPALEVQP